MWEDVIKKKVNSVDQFKIYLERECERHPFWLHSEKRGQESINLGNESWSV